MKLLSSYIPRIDECSLDFVDMIKQKGPIIEAFDEELKKFFLEVTGVVVLGTRLGAIKAELDGQSEAACLTEAALGTNKNILKTDNGLRLWKYFETLDYKKIRTSQVSFSQAKSSTVRITDFYFVQGVHRVSRSQVCERRQHQRELLAQRLQQHGRLGL